MNKRKNFQETDNPFFYSGRKIRIAVEEPQGKEERTAEEKYHGEHENSNKSVKETKIIQRVARNGHQTNNQQIENDPKAKLIRSLEKKLSDSCQNHLIGVFGINSDTIIANALRDLNLSRMYMDFYELPRSNVIDDVYIMFATAMLKFIKDRGLEGRWEYHQAIASLHEIASANYDLEDEDEFERFPRLCQNIERPEKCKNLTSFIKQQMNSNNAKFVWNFEVGFGELNYNLLNNLSEIANENLIVIVNTFGSLDQEARIIGSKLRSNCPNQEGYQILHKYFWIEDIINTD